GQIIASGDAEDGAAEQSLERLGAAGEIVDGDVETLLLEIAEPLGDRQRQIIQPALAADRERDVRLFDRLSAGGLRRDEPERGRGERQSDPSHACFLPIVRATCPLRPNMTAAACKGKSVRFGFPLPRAAIPAIAARLR